MSEAVMVALIAVAGNVVVQVLTMLSHRKHERVSRATYDLVANGTATDDKTPDQQLILWDCSRFQAWARRHCGRRMIQAD